MEFNRDNNMDMDDILGKLFDGDYDADIVLENERGQVLAFRQVYATVKGDVVYCILAPAEEVSDLPLAGAFVFMLTQECTFVVVQDAALSGEIFSEYYRSLAEEDE